MANQYSVVLRAKNDYGQVYDLEIIDSPSFLLDISALQIDEIGSVFGVSSQEVALPGTDTNNQFFNMVFNLGATPAVALNYTVPCQVLVNSEAVFTGKLYIANLVSDEYNNIIYNCVITNETVNFRTLTENKTLESLNWAQYNHPYTYASISSSWADSLFSGSIFYPLINYGADPNNPLSPSIELGGNLNQMDNVNTPLQVSQFKPAIQAKTIVDEIFNSINYKYTSSFFNTDYFKSLYYLTTPNGKEGISFVTPASGSYVYTNTTQSFASGFTTISYTKLLFPQEVYDVGDNFNPATSVYTAEYTGNHLVTINIPFNITSNFGPLVSNNAGRRFVIQIVDNTTNAVLYTNTTWLRTQTSGVISTGTIGINLTIGQSFKVMAVLITPPSNGLEQFTTRVTAGQNGVWLKVYTPQNPIGGTVEVGKVFLPDTHILDFMKGLIEKFNLVITPFGDNSNYLQIEPFNDWVELGDTIDWTDKVDRSVKYEVAHPISRMTKYIKFSDDIDVDVLNEYQYSNSDQQIYGSFKFVSDSDLVQGERKIGGFFAATPVKGIPVKGTNSDIVMPWLVKQEAGKYAEPYQFKPRLLHKQPIQQIPNNEMFGTVTGSFTPPSGSTNFYYIADPTNNGVRALNYYRTLLPTTDSPTIFTSSVDIHYQNVGYWPFQQNVVNGQCKDGVYNRYWAYYINSLYDVDARLLTCNVLLKPSDIKAIKLNNKYFIDGQYYRINKVNGANLVDNQSTEVELIKILPRKIPYTGRRRVFLNPINPEDYVDTIINDYYEDGTVNYINFELGTPITDPAVVAGASSLDDYANFGDVAVWNDIKPIVYNPNILVVGNSKYDESLNNVIVVGDGNNISSNTFNTSVFGNDNSINDASNAIMVVANSASIIDSNNVYLLQPSGSRIVSGSNNNVVINPINDILPTDATGSVYTGNLINQGTADFKNNVTITGSLVVNGVTISSGSVVPSTFNFSSSFGTDPTSVIFLSLPNSVGNSRAYNVKYLLTSGSSAINAGQLQVTGDGAVATVDIINQRNLTGAPTASYTADYTGSTMNVRTTFIGSSYIMSGSYQSLI